MSAARDLGGRAGLGPVDDHHVVFVNQFALIHVKRQPAADAANGIKNARRIIAERRIDRHKVAFASQSGRGELWHPPGRGIEGPAGIGRLDPVFGMDAQPKPAADRKDLVFLGDLQEFLLHRLYPFGIFCRHIIGFGEILGRVVKLPCVFAGIPGRVVPPGSRPWGQRSKDSGDPAILIQRTAAVVFEILLGPDRGGIRVAERRQQADAVDRVLLDPVHHLGRRDVEHIVDRWCDVDDMAELAAHLAVMLDRSGPVDDHGVARSTKMRGNQFC